MCGTRGCEYEGYARRMGREVGSPTASRVYLTAGRKDAGAGYKSVLVTPPFRDFGHVNMDLGMRLAIPITAVLLWGVFHTLDRTGVRVRLVRDVGLWGL